MKQPLRLRTMNGQTLEPLNKGVVQESTCSLRIDGASLESKAIRNRLSSLKRSNLCPNIRRRVIRCHSHTSVTEINTTSERLGDTTHDHAAPDILIRHSAPRDIVSQQKTLNYGKKFHTRFSHEFPDTTG